jgi:hypothetical protein
MGVMDVHCEVGNGGGGVAVHGCGAAGRRRIGRMLRIEGSAEKRLPHLGNVNCNERIETLPSTARQNPSGWEMGVGWV